MKPQEIKINLFIFWLSFIKYNVYGFLFLK